MCFYRRKTVELKKKSIRMCRLKKKTMSQITMDDDFIVPDVKPDIEKIVIDDGEVEIEEVKRLPEKVQLRGEAFLQAPVLPGGGRQAGIHGGVHSL